jgi:hypothetical protein
MKMVLSHAHSIRQQRDRGGEADQSLAAAEATWLEVERAVPRQRKPLAGDAFPRFVIAWETFLSDRLVCCLRHDATCFAHEGEPQLAVPSFEDPARPMQR